MSIKTSKILQTINFFAKKEGGKINRLKLIKLIWLADRLHLNKYGRTVIKDHYYALPHGPVPSFTMDLSRVPSNDIYKSSRLDIESISDVDERFFSDSDLEVLNKVWEKFGELSQFDLRDLSHEYPEWLRFKDNLEDDDLPNRYEMVMDDFFNLKDEKFNVLELEDDHISESRKEFLSTNSIENFLKSK